MVYKVVIFDLDGTLLDTLETLAYYGNLALEKWGYTPYEQDAYRYMVGSGAKNLIRRMLQKQGKETEEAFEKYYEKLCLTSAIETEEDSIRLKTSLRYLWEIQ